VAGSQDVRELAFGDDGGGTLSGNVGEGDEIDEEPGGDEDSEAQKKPSNKQ
jgi:hypothetical protein